MFGFFRKNCVEIVLREKPQRSFLGIRQVFKWKKEVVWQSEHR